MSTMSYVSLADLNSPELVSRENIFLNGFRKIARFFFEKFINEIQKLHFPVENFFLKGNKLQLKIYKEYVRAASAIERRLVVEQADHHERILWRNIGFYSGRHALFKNKLREARFNLL